MNGYLILGTENYHIALPKTQAENAPFIPTNRTIFPSTYTPLNPLPLLPKKFLDHPILTEEKSVLEPPDPQNEDELDENNELSLDNCVPYPTSNLDSYQLTRNRLTSLIWNPAHWKGGIYR
ncbi:Uncharacterized protein Fot_22010 [Forsythia ovata]|uniref:Uncharacterized protein n=1 Tax=Forsythia ovata TaxID=205694 RepID=A0ABD1UWH3_9LAMI